MKLRILCVGKTKDEGMEQWIAAYSARIRRYLPLEVVEVPDPKVDDKRRLQAEGERLLARVDTSDRVVLLDPRGETWASEEFASFLNKHMRNDSRRLTFTIGGAGGFSPEVRQRADVRWSLSPLTFTHDLARVLVFEQIYRAFCIIHNHPYSK